MNKKKKGSIATKISLLVIVMVIISNVICITLVVNNSKRNVSSVVKNTMYDMANSYSTMVTQAIAKNKGELDYYGYQAILSKAKVKGMDSSYVYVVNSEATMLYHPTKEKVGQPVSNEVVKGLVAKIQAGEHPEMAVTSYKFDGVTKFASYNVLENNNIVVVTADEADAYAGINSTTTVAIVVVIIIIIISFFVSTYFGRRLAKPLIKLSEIVKKVSEGEMKIDFTSVKFTNDEVGMIATDIQTMTGILNGIVEKIRLASENMSNQSSELNVTSEQTLAANEEISRAVGDVASGSSNMAVSIGDINNDLGNMTSETNTIDSSVLDIKEQTEAVQVSSSSMNEKMHNMRDSSNKMDAGIANISERIQKVNSVVEKVGDIINVIEGISGQTNLLSLNASIEAARAGEAGRGFAVVAEEIRVLSDNTNSEVNDIKEIINELIQECEECVKASNDVVKNNDIQKTEIESVLNEFENLDNQISLTAQKAEEIKSLVDEMVSINNSITSSSDGLTDVSSANAAATEEMTANVQELNAMMHGVADMANDMRNQSDELIGALSFFK